MEGEVEGCNGVIDEVVLLLQSNERWADTGSM